MSLETEDQSGTPADRDEAVRRPLQLGNRLATPEGVEPPTLSSED